MPATLAAARAGVTTGEWAGALREAFGSYRAPTGVGAAAAPAAAAEAVADLRAEVARVSDALGRNLKLLVGKPGLDGHSNGAEQIAVRARDAGMEVVYEGIRLTPAQIARSAVDEGVHVIGLSILSGSHRELIPTVMEALREAGGGEIPVVVGGIIPEADVAPLREAGVAAVYTPKDFELSRIMADIVALVPSGTASRPPRRERRRTARRHRPPERRRGGSGGRARRSPARGRRDRGAGRAQPGREPGRGGWRWRSCWLSWGPSGWAARRAPTSSGSRGRQAPASRCC
jgi:methylmalonyl-CoA mutase cobalamin-binding domain/chain